MVKEANPNVSFKITTFLDRNTREQHIAQHERSHDKGTLATSVRGKGILVASSTMVRKKGKDKARGGQHRKNAHAHAVHHPAGSHPQPKAISNPEKSLLERKTSRLVSSSEKGECDNGQNCDCWNPTIRLFHKRGQCRAGSKGAFSHREDYGDPPSPQMLTMPPGKGTEKDAVSLAAEVVSQG